MAKFLFSTLWEKLAPENGIHTKPSRIGLWAPAAAKEGLHGVSVEVNLNPRVFDLTTPSGLVFLNIAYAKFFSQTFSVKVIPENSTYGVGVSKKMFLFHSV